MTFASPSFIQLQLSASELVEQLRQVVPTTVAADSTRNSSVSERTRSDEAGFPPSDYSQPGFIQATIMQAQDLDLLGLPDAESPLTAIETYCCTDLYVGQGLCGPKDIGTLIIDRNLTGYEVWTYDLPLATSRNEAGAFVERRSAAPLTEQEERRATYPIRHTGEHVLILSHCDPSLNTEVSVSGVTEWHNPFGLLPGRLFGFMQFHRYATTLYLLFAGAWIAASIQRWRQLMTIHYYTAGVILLCICEHATAYAELDRLNTSGTRDAAAVTLAVVFSVARQIAIRTLVVFISLGYRVVKASISPDHTSRLFVLGSAYICLETVLELIWRWQQTHAINDYYRILLTMPVAIINAVFCWWTFVSLYQLMVHLEERQQERKFALYRTFANSTVCIAGVAVLLALYQLLVSHPSTSWSRSYLVDLGAACLVASLVVSIAVVFRPANLVAAFDDEADDARIEEESEDDEDDDDATDDDEHNTSQSESDRMLSGSGNHGH